MLKTIAGIILGMMISIVSAGQQLQPGFDKQEFLELLKIGARTTADSGYYNKLPKPLHARLKYESALTGFDNYWQMWQMDNGVGVISVRGTTKSPISFLANIYAAMVPAKGVLELRKDSAFHYTLSENPRAAVHAGFLVAMAYLSLDIVPRIDSAYASGTKEFILTGHSQGGAITYLLTSYLYQLKKEKRLPADIVFKSCIAAPPKPGNLFYAYDFEHLTANGWSYVVVNAADWVPEMPISIQTVDDFNETNPMPFAKSMIRKQKFPINLVLSSAYGNMSRPLKKAQRRYQRWLGKRLGKIVQKNLKELSTPAFYNSNNYVRTGNTIVLMPDSAYFVKFPEVRDSIWHNHIHAPYLYLTEKLPDNDNAHTKVNDQPALNGEWQLEYIAGQHTALDSLFPGRKPLLVLQTTEKQLHGNSGCNSISGTFEFTPSAISFKGPIVMTKMFCPGDGEKIFLETLQSVNNYAATGTTLTLIKDDVAEMRFIKLK
jgi:heat shock protein HslJ